MCGHTECGLLQCSAFSEHSERTPTYSQYCIFRVIRALSYRCGLDWDVGQMQDVCQDCCLLHPVSPWRPNDFLKRFGNTNYCIVADIQSKKRWLRRWKHGRKRGWF